MIRESILIVFLIKIYTTVILQVKWTLVVCVFCYSSYIAAQFYPRFYTLIPTAIVLGFGAAPLWSAKCSYLTQLAHRSGRSYASNLFFP
jgi:hypothetical protein